MRPAAGSGGGGSEWRRRACLEVFVSQSLSSSRDTSSLDTSSSSEALAFLRARFLPRPLAIFSSRALSRLLSLSDIVLAASAAALNEGRWGVAKRPGS